MPNPNEGTDVAAAQTAGAGTGKASGTPTDAHLAPILSKLTGVESLIGRFGQRLGDLERRIPNAGGPRPTIQQPAYVLPQPEGEMEPLQAELAGLRQEVEDNRRERELDRFARVSGASPQDWQEITNRLAANEEQYHRFRRARDGRAVLDYFASYDSVWKDIQIERVNAARQAQGQQRSVQDQQTATARAQAVVSGAGAVGTEADAAPLDISKMSSAELLTKVLIPQGLVDPNDVPSTKPYLG